ncbi:hypothetical protein BGW38_007057 [Lunasporangiospora selenospora]|uniref:Uncharacterized protein n=1 Tax=Lunasporangiospora selenospora TaxID=979761 RepID=A0A9P6G4Y5_9FUNG|nr:hypothetical protein BGW38_007057 [Lunasporangiospora selenospora]
MRRRIARSTQSSSEAQASQPKAPSALIKTVFLSGSKCYAMWEHPMVTLYLGYLKENIEAVASDSEASQMILDCVQQAVREASSIKRRAQELIGLYIQEMVSSAPKTLLQFLTKQTSRFSTSFVHASHPTDCLRRTIATTVLRMVKMKATRQSS